MATRNSFNSWVCSMECSEFATHFCCCKSPETFLCSKHLEAHMHKSVLPHEMLRIEALSYIRIPGYRERLRKREEVKEAAIEQLYGNLQVVKECRIDIARTAENIVFEVTAWARDRIEELKDTEQKIKTEIDEIIAEAERVFYEDSPIGIHPATKAFREFVPEKVNFTLFSYLVTPCSLTQMLSEVLDITEGLNFEFYFDCSKLTPEAKQKLAKKGPYVYETELESGKLMSPVRLPDGSVYIGEWKGGKRIGKGKLFKSDGSLLEGYWYDDNINQEGRVVNATGYCYEGGFCKGVINGIGRLENLEGTYYYNGEWLNAEKHGYGTEHFEGESDYEGMFEMGKKSGQGMLKKANGDCYTGEFKDNMFNGRGIYASTNGEMYEGDWVNGKMHGKGKFFWPDGKEYDGDYIQGKKHGYGVFKWDGKLYEGDWCDGEMHGKGFLTTKETGRNRYIFTNSVKVKQISDKE